MELKRFSVNELFGLYNHKIEFSNNEYLKNKATITMIFGKNGVGKTTILKMIQGFMQLDFTIFRNIKFKNASLVFSDGSIISVKSIYENRECDYRNKERGYRNKEKLTGLMVKYNDFEVVLNPERPGPLLDEDFKKQQDLIGNYRLAIGQLTFEFIDSERIINRNKKNHDHLREDFRGKIPSSLNHEKLRDLAKEVMEFIKESQLRSYRYFHSDEPDLFNKLLKNIENSPNIEIEELKKRIITTEQVEVEYEFERLGIIKEFWDRDKLLALLDDQNLKQEKQEKQELKLSIINSYVEIFETKYSDKINLAKRLLKFETCLNGLLLNKKIKIKKDSGFVIKTKVNDVLDESQLSTGEYHLIYLSVLALCTKVVGTIIAIDEPEMSMNINWQNKLVSTLTDISSKANPQFIFATHSPDISAKYSNSMETELYEQN